MFKVIHKQGFNINKLHVGYRRTTTLIAVGQTYIGVFFFLETHFIKFKIFKYETISTLRMRQIEYS